MLGQKGKKRFFFNFSAKQIFNLTDDFCFCCEKGKKRKKKQKQRLFHLPVSFSKQTAQFEMYRKRDRTEMKMNLPPECCKIMKLKYLRQRSRMKEKTRRKDKM